MRCPKELTAGIILSCHVNPCSYVPFVVHQHMELLRVLYTNHFRNSYFIGSLLNIGVVLAFLSTILFPILMPTSHTVEQTQNTREQQPEYAPQEMKSNPEQLNSQIPIPSPQPPNSNVEPQTEVMEVHKHPHHITHKKKWTEYFLEFLMIFFAVTLGFYAENIREYASDAAREKEYMRSMVEDLKQDTANCNKVISQNTAIIHGLDTLITYVLKPAPAQDVSLIYAYCIKYRYYNPEVQFSERTMSQLKNNGGLRLVKKSDVSDALSMYDQGVRFCDRQRDQVLHYYAVLDDTELALFDFGPIKPLWDSLFNADVLSVPIPAMVKGLEGKVHLQTTNQDLLKKYMNEIIYDQVAVAIYNNDLAAQRDKAVSLIELIQKKYGLRDNKP
jgi:hypothetical protein